MKGFAFSHTREAIFSLPHTGSHEKGVLRAGSNSVLNLFLITICTGGSTKTSIHPLVIILVVAQWDWSPQYMYMMVTAQGSHHCSGNHRKRVLFYGVHIMKGNHPILKL